MGTPLRLRLRSMFLAGISHEAGWLWLFAGSFIREAAQYYSLDQHLLATIAIIYGAFATMMKTDLKYINAYSSVSHCGFVLLGYWYVACAAELTHHKRCDANGIAWVDDGAFFAAIGMLG